MELNDKTVLFLCTGNYYRSRFSEEFFNTLAPIRLPNWKATSRALAIERGHGNVGPISPYTLEELERRNLQAMQPVRHPLQCTEEDLLQADLIIALKETEHRPMLIQRFPEWPDKVTYWHVHDVDQAHPALALSEIAGHVERLIDELTEEDIHDS